MASSPEPGHTVEDRGPYHCANFERHVFLTFCLTLGIILSQLVAVVCKVLIHTGRGSLSVLFFLHNNLTVTKDQGPVTRSIVSANHWVKRYRNLYVSTVVNTG